MGELPGWLNDKGERRNRNNRSRKQEKERANEINGKVQAGSGSSWRRPEDVQSSDRLEQIKYTDADGYRLTAVELARVFEHAVREGREGGFVIEFSRHKIRLVGTIERTKP